MKISELSKQTGVSPRMLRYLEQQGLLEAKRTNADYRNFTKKDITKVLEIREWQRLGFHLKEVKEIILNPEAANQILQNVFQREREKYLEKHRSLQDLRQKITGEKVPYFENRVAHPIKNIEQIVVLMEELGWSANKTEYLRFADWSQQQQSKTMMIGEILEQSSFYILSSSAHKNETKLQKFAWNFVRSTYKVCRSFDGDPPKIIEQEDLCEFFAPNEILINLEFTKEEKYQIILPYQIMFTLMRKYQE